MSLTDTENSQQLQLALVNGNSVIEHPEDLYIPPDALEVFLDTFEGPLDFLLYLIKKQKFDILELPIMKITVQYMEYVELMKTINLELASEYLVMAAILAEIKSRILLPVNKELLEDEEDPRAELIRQLLEYEKFKNAAKDLDETPRLERDTHTGYVEIHHDCSPKVLEPEVSTQDLLIAMQSILLRTENFSHHEIRRESLSTRERMTRILDLLKGKEDYICFSNFFNAEEGRQGVVVTFLAILELAKEQFITFTQSAPFAQIYVKIQTNSQQDLGRIF